MTYVWTDINPGFTSDPTPINALGHKVEELDALAQLGQLWALKTADETINNSSVLQNDDALFLNLQANATYYYKAHIINNTNASAGFKLDHLMPSGATWKSGTFMCQAGPQVGIMTTNALSGVNGNGTDVYAEFWTAIQTTNSGLLQLRWAQNAAHASNAIVKDGSWIKAVRVA